MNLGEFHENPLSIIYHHPFHIFTTSHFVETSHLSVWGSVDFLNFFLLTMLVILFIIHWYSYSFSTPPLFHVVYTKHRFQQIVETTSLCFLELNEDMLILQFGWGIATQDGFFLLSFSFKTYNFIFIQCRNWFAYIFKTMNWILVISG